MATTYAQHVALVRRQCLAVRLLCSAGLIIGAVAGVLTRAAFAEPLAGKPRR